MLRYGRNLWRYNKALHAVEARLKQIHHAGDPRLALDEAALREAAELADLTDPRIDVRAAHHLGWLHWCRYLADNANRDDLDRALVLLRLVFRDQPGSVPEEIRGYYRHDGDNQAALDEVESETDEGVAQMAAYGQTGELGALQAAAGHFRAALAAFPASLPGQPELYSNLGSALRELFERTHEPGLLREAAGLGRHAVAQVSADHSDRTRILSNLGTTLQTLSEQAGETEAAEEAVKVLRDAVAIAGQDHPDLAGYRSNLGSALRHLYSLTGDARLLDEAVRVLQESVEAIRPDEADRHKAFTSRSIGLLELFTLTGKADYLQASVAAARAAVAAVPAGHPDRAAVLSTLGTTLRRQAEHDGHGDQLGEAVAVLREAITLTPSPHANRATYLSNLANALRALFHHNGQTALLEQAVDTLTQAAGLIPAGHSARSAFLTGLSAVHLALYDRADRPASLAAAVQASRDAVAAAGRDSANRPLYLCNLGVALLSLARADTDAGSAAEAVGWLRQAVDATPATHTMRGQYLDSLGTALRLLAALDGPVGAPGKAVSRPEALAEAVAAGQAAVAATPAAHFLRDGFRFNLAESLLAIHESTADTEAITAARDNFLEIAGSAVAPPRLRLRAYRSLAALPAQVGVSAYDALAAIESAVELLPQVVPHWLNRGDRERDVASIAGLPAQAAAAAVAAGQPGRAVELLEQTRGILVADILDARSGELSRLASREPGLAAEFQTLRRRIAALDSEPYSWSIPGSDSDSSVWGLIPEAVTAVRQQADADWRDLLTRIRAADGLHDFLRPPRIDRLAAAAAGGPVVFVYADQSWCDALILTAGSPQAVRVVPLPLTYDEAVNG